MARFLTHLRVERGLSPATQSAYRIQIEGYLRHLTRHNVALSESKKETVVAHIGERQRTGLKPSSVFHLALAIRQFHRFLFSEKILATDPTATLKLPKFDHIIPEPLSVVQMSALLPPLISDSFKTMRTQTMIDAAYNLGLRVSELINLKTDDVNFEEGFVRVRRGKGGRDRIVPFGINLGATLKRYIEIRNRQPNANSPHLFVSAKGKPISRGTFWWLLKRWANRAGVKRRVSPHQLRHSFATHLLAGGANLRGIQAALGHKDIRQTQIYSHVDVNFLRETIRHHPRFK
ncbi:MAG: tyrosine-type recombinase/integrase [Bdellovibrionales bacterium]|nr:tyrosine-type recombinase/integrase [Bdellovibrionales bacterium]